ncbi:MAG: ABC transporter permease [Nitrospirae bacterium]|jgi:lipopolysaccharide transport system permease protein|nr:ABC transporter permease [Nitrospirota bacterium]
MKNRSLEYYKDLIVVLTQKELKVKYKRSFLGYLWSIANPLALALVFFIAFKVVMRIPIENYTLFLITGLFPWQWFSNSVNGSPAVFVGNASLIKKVNFRREVLVIATVLNDMLHFILSIPVIVVFLFIYGMKPSLIWLAGIPVLLILQFIVVFGFSIAISSINLFFRDIERIVFIFTTLMFYLTPIIYSEDMIPHEFRNLILLNPLSTLMISWRNLFMNGTLNFPDIIPCFIYSAILAAIGYFIFRKLNWKFAEVL